MLCCLISVLNIDLPSIIALIYSIKCVSVSLWSWDILVDITSASFSNLISYSDHLHNWYTPNPTQLNVAQNTLSLYFCFCTDVRENLSEMREGNNNLAIMSVCFLSIWQGVPLFISLFTKFTHHYGRNCGREAGDIVGKRI